MHTHGSFLLPAEMGVEPREGEAQVTAHAVTTAELERSESRRHVVAARHPMCMCLDHVTTERLGKGGCGAKMYKAIISIAELERWEHPTYCLGRISWLFLFCLREVVDISEYLIQYKILMPSSAYSSAL